MPPYGSKQLHMSTSPRDLRLDFFRGLSLLFIFVDHVPDNLFSYLTLANFVFSDAAEVFVFISGYTAAIVFGGMIAKFGTPMAMLQVLRRCWTLYVAHVFLFVIFTAQVAWTAERFENPLFLDEMRVAAFLYEPHVAILRALSLQFQPEFMGILPLYIVLLLGFAFLLPVLRTAPGLILAGSLLLYLGAQVFHLNLAKYPDGVWFHNPIAWQILFVVGALCAALRGSPLLSFLGSNPLFVGAALFLALCVVTRTAFTVDTFIDILPAGLYEGLWPLIDKTYLGPLRLLNFLALAFVTMRLVPPDAAPPGRTR